MTRRGYESMSVLSGGAHPGALSARLVRLPHGWAWLMAALAAALIAVFGPIWSYGWLNWDDPINVTENPFLNPLSVNGLVALWRHAYAGLYIPVAYSLFAAETWVSRALGAAAAPAPPDPHVFRAVSLCLHALNGGLVWGILRRREATPIAAVAGAGLFLLHPIQVESVAWISEQRGLLSAALGLAAVYLHLLDSASPTARASLVRDVMATGLFVLALLAKPQAAAFPLMAFVLGGGAARAGASMRVRGLRLFPWIVAVTVVFTLSRGLQPADAAGRTIGWGQRIVVAGDAMAFYARQLVAPHGFAVDYGRSPDVVLEAGETGAMAAVVWLLLGVVAGVRQLHPVREPVAVWILGLLPTLGFVPFVHQGFSTVADRYAYAAMLGPAIAVADLWMWQGMAQPSRAGMWRRGAIVATVIGCGVLSRAQVTRWKDSVTVFSQCVQVNPLSFIGHLNLGTALVGQGRVAEAVPVLERAAEVGAAYRKVYKAWAALAEARSRLGRFAEAAEAYREAIRREPAWPGLHNDFGVVLAQQGKFADAALQFGEALRLGLDTPEVRRNLEAASRLGHNVESGRPNRSPATPPPGGREPE